VHILRTTGRKDIFSAIMSLSACGLVAGWRALVLMLALVLVSLVSLIS